FFLLQRAEHQVGGHQLGERSRLEALVGLLGGKQLAAGDIRQHPGARDELRWLRRLRERKQRESEQQEKKTARHRGSRPHSRPHFHYCKAANYSRYRPTIIGRRLSSD